MTPFANAYEAEKQGRSVIATAYYFGAQVNIYEAKPHEAIFQHIGKTARYRFANQESTREEKIKAAGYDVSGGCFPYVVLESQLVICLDNQSLTHLEIL